MKFNYSSLQTPVSKADIEAYKVWRSNGSEKDNILNLLSKILYAVAILSITLLFVFVAYYMPSLIYAAPVVILFVYILITLTKRIEQKKIEKFTRMYLFSRDNGIRLGFDIPSPSHGGMLFSIGHSRSMKSALLFPDNSYIGNYQYTTGNGKYQTTLDWKVVRIELPRKLPHMVLDAKKNNFMGRFTNLPKSFRGQTISLEGDFNNHFTLYAPKQYERDALYVFTPDVMAALIDKGSTYDIEVVDNSLLLFDSGQFALDSEAELQAVVHIINTLAAEFRQQIDFYADERVGNRAINAVAEHGRRLDERISFQAVILIIIMTMYFALFLFSMVT